MVLLQECSLDHVTFKHSSSLINIFPPSIFKAVQPKLPGHCRVETREIWM